MNKSTKSTLVLAVSLLLSAPNAFAMAHAARAAVRYAYWGLTLAPLLNNIPQFARLKHTNGSKEASTKFDLDKKSAAFYGAVPTIGHFASKGALSTVFRATAPVLVSPMWRVPFGIANAASSFWAYKQLPGNKQGKTFTGYLAQRFSK